MSSRDVSADIPALYSVGRINFFTSLAFCAHFSTKKSPFRHLRVMHLLLRGMEIAVCCKVRMSEALMSSNVFLLPPSTTG
jgi:hypothetical protein